MKIRIIIGPDEEVKAVTDDCASCECPCEDKMDEYVIKAIDAWDKRKDIFLEVTKKVAERHKISDEIREAVSELVKFCYCVGYGDCILDGDEDDSDN